MSSNLESFWARFYDDLANVIFSDKAYVFEEIANEPKTMREISESTGVPYMTVRKYIRWAKERGLVTVVGAKKSTTVLAEKWLLTFLPTIVEVETGALLIKLKLKLFLRRVFCEEVCPFRERCPTYSKLKDDLVPVRFVVVDRRFVREGDFDVCTNVVEV
jgi:hypothetical protein